MTKKISVALATYKGGQYLEPLLDSLAAQHCLPYELVVSDDNSPDNTLEVLEKFSQRAPFPVRILRNEAQLGVIGNFNNAFIHCEGELIAYCDQDDLWAPEKLATCVKHFDNEDVKLVMHRSEVVDKDAKPLGYHIPETNKVEFGTVHFPSTPDMSYGLGHQMLFDASIYKNYSWIFSKGFKALEDIGGNYDIQLRFLAGLAGDIVSIEQAFVKFRRHESATSDAGVVDTKTATKSGFLNKHPDDYARESRELQAIADTFKHEVLSCLKSPDDKLIQYIDFMYARAAMYLKRGSIYASSSIFTRMGALISLCLNRAYTRKSQRGFGKKAILVDTFVAISGLDLAKKIIALKQ